MLKYRSEQMAQLAHDLLEADGELTPEQEQAFLAAGADEEGLFDEAALIQELEEQALLLEERFVKPYLEQIGTWRHRAQRMRALLAARLAEYLDKTGSKKKSVRGVESTLVLQSPRESLDMNSEALAKETHATGFTEEEVAKSGLPMVYFEPVQVFKARKDVIRAHLKEGVAVGPARFVLGDPSVQIRRAGTKPKASGANGQ